MENPSLAPFRHSENSPKPKKWSTNLYELQAYPNSLIREVHDYSTSVSNEDPVEANLKALNRARELFSELQDTYKVRNAGFRTAIGHSIEDNRPVGIIISDKIEGVPYAVPGNDADIDERRKGITIAPEHKVAAKSLLSKLTSYYTDKIRSDEDFLDDVFSIHQYIYTEPTKEIPDGEFVLVDMDPPLIEDNEVSISELYAQDMLDDLAMQTLHADELKEWRLKTQQMLSQPPAAA